MKTIAFVLTLLAAGMCWGQARTGDGSYDNPYRGGGEAPSLPAQVVYEEMRAQPEGRMPAAQMEKRLKQLVAGKKGDAQWEVTMAHQLSLLSAFVRTTGDNRLTVELAAAAVGYYEAAEKALTRDGAPSKNRARMAAHMGFLQDEYLADPQAAERSLGRALALDPGHEQAQRRKARIEREKQRKEKPGGGGKG